MSKNDMVRICWVNKNTHVTGSLEPMERQKAEQFLSSYFVRQSGEYEHWIEEIDDQRGARGVMDE